MATSKRNEMGYLRKECRRHFSKRMYEVLTYEGSKKDWVRAALLRKGFCRLPFYWI